MSSAITPSRSKPKASTQHRAAPLRIPCADVDAGKISKEDLFTRAEELMKERIGGPASVPTPLPVFVERKAKQSGSSAVVKPLEWKRWEKLPMNDGADDVINLGICPVCKESLRLVYPDAVHAGGQIVHATCAAKMAEQ
jgi:hypothetical protein